MVLQRWVAALLLLAVSAVVLHITSGVGWHRSGAVRNGAARGVDGSSQIESEPTVGATPTGWWDHPVAYTDRRPELPAATIGGLVRSMPVVADVHVVHIGPALFNTDSGEAPTPDPRRFEFGLQVGSLVVLELDEAYKGVEPGTAGFVVWQWGGSVEGFTDQSLPPLVFLSDSVGTAFLIPYGEEDIANAVSFMKLVANTAEEWSEAGAKYRPADLLVFYEHAGDVALSALEGDGPYDAYEPAEVSLTEFMEELIGALSTPTP